MHDLRGLVKSRGWAHLGELLKAQVHNRVQSVVRSPLATLDEAVGKEFMKGEISGIELFQAIPDIEISELEKLLKETNDGE